MAKTIQTKSCSKCKDFKPLSEFGRDISRKDGLHRYCKNCQRKYGRKYDRGEKRKSVRKRYRQSEKGKVANSKAHKQYSNQYPERIKAKSAANDAIKVGKLISPKFLLCHYCPKPAQQYHHWHGYERKYWLDVVPVCIKCHVFSSK